MDSFKAQLPSGISSPNTFLNKWAMSSFIRSIAAEILVVCELQKEAKNNNTIKIFFNLIKISIMATVMYDEDKTMVTYDKERIRKIMEALEGMNLNECETILNHVDLTISKYFRNFQKINPSDDSFDTAIDYHHEVISRQPK